MESVEIYNMYWMRIKFSASLNVATTVNRFVYAFTTHQQIDNLDTTVNDYLTSFSAGKTTWNDEIITASILVVHDLRSKGLIVAPGEILRFDDVSMATDWKTLILIYRNLGGDYSDKLKEAKLEYVKAINLKRFTIDKDNDGYTDLNEISNRVSEMTR